MREKELQRIFINKLSELSGSDWNFVSEDKRNNGIKKCDIVGMLFGELWCIEAKGAPDSIESEEAQIAKYRQVLFAQISTCWNKASKIGVLFPQNKSYRDFFSLANQKNNRIERWIDITLLCYLDLYCFEFIEDHFVVYCYKNNNSKIEVIKDSIENFIEQKKTTVY